MKSFDELVAALTPIVFENVNEKASVACVREMVEDIAYLIKHGYTIQMYSNSGKKPNGV